MESTTTSEQESSLQENESSASNSASSSLSSNLNSNEKKKSIKNKKKKESVESRAKRLQEMEIIIQGINEDEIYNYFWDCHCHIHDVLKDDNFHSGCCLNEEEKEEDVEEKEDRSKMNLEGLLISIEQLRTPKLSLMGVFPTDWEHVQLVARNQKVCPAFGVHPWYAHRIKDNENWLAELESYVLSNENSIIGEIGLDRIAVTPETQQCEFSEQVPIFISQLALAKKLNKPVSIHCVRAFGHIVDIFRSQDCPEKIMMHSFGGSEGMIDSLIKIPNLHIYFSFSSVINERAAKTSSVIKKIPDDRILIETDIDHPEGIDAYMYRICEFVALAKGWSITKAAYITWRNAQEFFFQTSTSSSSS